MKITCKKQKKVYKDNVIIKIMNELVLYKNDVRVFFQNYTNLYNHVHITIFFKY